MKIVVSNYYCQRLSYQLIKEHKKNRKKVTVVNNKFNFYIMFRFLIKFKKLWISN